MGQHLLTEAGHAHHLSIRNPINEITARLFGDFPEDEPAVAGRVLSIVTVQANEEIGRRQVQS